MAGSSGPPEVPDIREYVCTGRSAVKTDTPGSGVSRTRRMAAQPDVVDGGASRSGT